MIGEIRDFECLHVLRSVTYCLSFSWADKLTGHPEPILQYV
jgi:hypothetical protein